MRNAGSRYSEAFQSSYSSASISPFSTCARFSAHSSIAIAALGACGALGFRERPAYKDDSNGTFYVQCYYRDARGSKRHKMKRGFSSEVEAAVWEGQFKSLNGGAMDMTFSEFVEVYASEVKPRIRAHTWITKEYIINDKLVPFFGDMRMCDVRPIDVIRW